MKTEGAIKNKKSSETGNILYTRHRMKTKKQQQQQQQKQPQKIKNVSSTNPTKNG